MLLIGKRDQVRQLRLMHPHWSLADIAEETGLTRQRVHQLLLAEGLPTRRVTPATVIDRVLASMDERATDNLPANESALQTAPANSATETNLPPAQTAEDEKS